MSWIIYIFHGRFVLLALLVFIQPITILDFIEEPQLLPNPQSTLPPFLRIGVPHVALFKLSPLSR